jgi:hypothetical protein
VDVGALVPWRPAPLPLEARTRANLRAGWRRLVADCATLGSPGGFGALLAGRALAFPLDGAAAAARALARACAADDAPSARDAGGSLLGLGGGLTPSGDDYVGAALFARHLLAASGTTEAVAWTRAAEALVAMAAERTHPISAALLGDLAAGLGWASLHDLVAALAAGEPDAAAGAAHRLVRLGHSSGWDMLAGLGAGLGELAA